MANLNEKTITPLPAEKFDPVHSQSQLEMEKISKPSLTYLQDSWRKLKKNKIAMLSLIILIIVSILALLAPWIAPYHYAEQNPQFANLPPKIPFLSNIAWFDGTAQVAGEQIDRYAQQGVEAGQYFILGTDALGRDLFSRIIYGTRVSLFIGIMAALFNLIIGVPYGLIAGWLGGKTENVMMRILEVFSGIPNLVVVILLLLVLKPGLTSIILALGLTEWIPMARVVRAQTKRLKNEEYILASQSLGQSGFNISFKHILPNISGTIIIQTIYSIPAAIFFEAFLSFIGLGIPSPMASLGTLINDGYKTFQFLPHLMWYPALAISVIILAFNLFGNGLRDALDPRIVED